MNCCSLKVTRGQVVFRRPPRLPGPPELGPTRLITDGGDVQRYFAHRETDALGGVVRGLKEYLEQLATDDGNGVIRVFKAVIETQAEAEEVAQFPSAVVKPDVEATYEAMSMTPQVSKGHACEDTGTSIPGAARAFLSAPSELSASLKFEVWAVTKEERIALVAMLEDAFQPVPDWFGARLELPHYHHVRARYTMAGITYSQDALQRYWRATMRVLACVPVVKVYRLPDAQFRVKATVVDGTTTLA